MHIIRWRLKNTSSPASDHALFELANILLHASLLQLQQNNNFKFTQQA